MRSMKSLLGKENDLSPETPPEAKTQTEQSTLNAPKPESESAKPSSAGSPFSEDAARGAFGGDFSISGAEMVPGPGSAGAGDGIVPQEVFCGAFVAAFDVSAQLSGLTSLAISEPEKPAAQAAGEGLYAVAKKHPSLHWLIRTDGAYVKLAVATLPFALGKAQAAAQELQARRKGATPSPADAEAEKTADSA